MKIDIEKYSQVSLIDVVRLYSSTSFLRQQQAGDRFDKMNSFLFCPDTYVPGRMEVSLVKESGFIKGYVVIPRNGVNIDYLASILNSTVSWAVMTNGNLEKRSSITLKRLGNVLIRILPEREQQAVANLQYLIVGIRNRKREIGRDPYLSYWESVYEQLRNAIALELVLPRVFKGYEIEMLGSWCSLIDDCSAIYPRFNWTQWQEYLGRELLAPQNVVTGNMNKFHVVMNSVVEQMKEKI